jgi:hypothetical protein
MSTKETLHVDGFNPRVDAGDSNYDQWFNAEVDCIHWDKEMVRNWRHTLPRRVYRVAPESCYLMVKREKINAIKSIREDLGLSLSDAKHLVELMTWIYETP